MAKYRRLKKEVSDQSTASTSAVSPPFKNTSSLVKAAARAKHVLPNSPRKRTVVKKLFEAYVEQLPDHAARQTRSTALDSDVVNEVKEFYERDDISRQAPGIKDDNKRK